MSVSVLDEDYEAEFLNLGEEIYCLLVFGPVGHEVLLNLGLKILLQVCESVL